MTSHSDEPRPGRPEGVQGDLFPHAFHEWNNTPLAELWNWLAIYQDEICWRRSIIADGTYPNHVVDSMAREIQRRVEACRLIVAELKRRGYHAAQLPDFD